MVIVETERLHLRPLRADDGAFIHELYNQPSFLHFIGDRGIRTIADAQAYIESGPVASYATHGFGLFAAELREDGTPAGVCGIMRKEWLPDPDLAYAFLPHYWSRGLAREAATAVVAHAWRVWQLPRLVAVVTPDNAASTRLLENLGFAVELPVIEPHSHTELILLARSAPAP